MCKLKAHLQTITRIIEMQLTIRIRRWFELDINGMAVYFKLGGWHMYYSSNAGFTSEVIPAD